MVGYASSGITLLNRCFAGDSRLVCLSEINSRFLCPTPINTPQEQFNVWYQEKIPKAPMLEEIRRIRFCAEQMNRMLLVRDWSFGSFVPLKYNNFHPSRTLNTVDDLKSEFGSSNVVIFCMVRNPIDVWLSMKSSPKAFHDKNLEFLFEFIQDVQARGIRIFKYEDFCEDSLGVINSMYSFLGLEKIKYIKLSDNVTGDTNDPGSSRGLLLNEATPLPRRLLTKGDKLFLLRETRARHVMEMLNYDTKELKL